MPKNTHFPKLLENNPIFRKLFLWRKLFLTKSKARHFSQFGEDISLLRLFPKAHQGIYVDVGCYHPIKHSNTHALYKRGWSGINIDIDKIKIEGFDLLRPRDTNIACAVSNTDGMVDYYSGGFYSLVSTLESDFKVFDATYETKQVRAKKLETIIDESPFADREIDLLTVDVEAHDSEVLKSLGFKKYKPNVVVVEIHVNGLTELLDSDCYVLLNSHGYDLVNWCGPSAIFQRIDWANSSKKYKPIRQSA